jgi:hypothetical protein
MPPPGEGSMTREEWKRVNVNLSERADTLLRKNLRRKGDLTRLFNEAVLNTNWDELGTVRRRRTYQEWKETSLGMTSELHERLKRYAKERGIEFSALIDAIIISYYSQEHRNP